MVAYSFSKRFVTPIETGIKRQTVRAHRRRHARVGERLQLYSGMRTKSCWLIRDDVVCSCIDEIAFDLRSLSGVDDPVDARTLNQIVTSHELPMLINGIPLDHAGRTAFAAAGGFRGWQIDGHPLNAFAAMVLFWMHGHGPRLFEGVVIQWAVERAR